MGTSLGKRIKALREALRISQEELSQRLSLIENDKRSLKADELILLSKSLNIPQNFLEERKKCLFRGQSTHDRN